MIHPCRGIWIKATDGMAGGDTDPWTRACCQALTQAREVTFSPKSSGLLCSPLSSIISTIVGVTLITMKQGNTNGEGNELGVTVKYRKVSINNVFDIIRDKLLPMKWDNTTLVSKARSLILKNLSKTCQSKRLSTRQNTMALIQGNLFFLILATNDIISPCMHLLKWKLLVFVV